MFRDSSRFGYEIISQFDHIDRFFHETPRPERPVWCSIYAPSYARIRNELIVPLYGKSKISVAMNGAGVKTFRDREIMNSVMARPYDKLAWSHEWTHGHNCLRFDSRMVGVDGSMIIRTNAETSVLDAALRDADLYQIYQNALVTLDAYRPKNYFPEYFIPTIQKLL